MDDLRRITIERECERLVMTYTHLVDFGEAERVAELFAPDGVWEAPQARVNGQEEIRAAFAARQRKVGRVSRHICTNLAINVIDDRTAEGVVYLTLYRHDGEPARTPRPLDLPLIVGEYRDRFVLTDAGWRFACRRASVGFVRQDASGASPLLR